MGGAVPQKNIGVVCYHKIGQSMQHEEKRLREQLRGWEGKDPEEERLLKQKHRERNMLHPEKENVFQNRMFALDSFTDVACARRSHRHAVRMPVSAI